MKHVRTDASSVLSIHRKQLFNIALPYWIFIDGQAVGVMGTNDVNINIPPGTYNIGVKIVLQFFKWRLSIGTEQQLHLNAGSNTHLLIKDREKWWNLLFDIDLVLCLLNFFITLPSPWGTVYDMVSNGFFLLWAIHVWTIRTRFFTFTIH